MTKLSGADVYVHYDCVYKLTQLWVKLDLMPQGPSLYLNATCVDFVNKHAKRLSKSVACIGSVRLMMLRLGFPEIGFDECLAYAKCYVGGR